MCPIPVHQMMCASDSYIRMRVITAHNRNAWRADKCDDDETFGAQVTQYSRWLLVSRLSAAFVCQVCGCLDQQLIDHKSLCLRSREVRLPVCDIRVLVSVCGDMILPCVQVGDCCLGKRAVYISVFNNTCLADIGESKKQTILFYTFRCIGYTVLAPYLWC